MRALFLIAVLVCLIGCKPKQVHEDSEALTRKEELAKAHAEIEGLQAKLRSQQDESELSKANLEAKEVELAEKQKFSAAREARMAPLEAELDNLKKQDAQVYRGIAEIRERRQFAKALNLYRMFIQDFPESPLVADSERAIADLSTKINSGETSPYESIAAQGLKRKDQELKRRLPFGAVTVQELAPLLKNKTSSEIAALLGNPDHLFPNGTDWGYNDRALAERTGERAMLIITFNAGKVSAFRVGYSGRKITP